MQLMTLNSFSLIDNNQKKENCDIFSFLKPVMTFRNICSVIWVSGESIGGSYSGYPHFWQQHTYFI